MRTAQDIINDYRARGYSEERLRALANGRSEPTRSELLALLDSEAGAPAPESAAEEIMGGILQDAESSEHDALPDEEEAVELVIDTADREAETLEVVLPDETDEDESEEAKAETAEDETSEDETTEDAAESADSPLAVTSDMIFVDDVQDEPVAEAVCEDMETTVESETTEADAPEEDAIESALEEDVMSATLEADTETEKETEPVMTKAEGEVCEADDAEEAVEEAIVEPAAHESVGIDFEDDDEAVAEDAEEAPAATLASVHVERLTAEEYEVRAEETGLGEPDSDAELIDLRALEEISELGEHWPSVESVEAAEHEDVLTDQEESALIAFHGDGEQMDIFQALGSDKAARRSLLVIQQALEEDPELETSLHENNVVALNAPYAMDDEAAGPELVADDDVMMDEEESALIQFPSDMIPMYEAIGSTRDLGVGDLFNKKLVIDTAQETALEANLAAEGSGFSHTERLDDGVEAEIAQMRNWLAELEDELNLKDLETRQLKTLIEDRDSVMAMQSSEIDTLRAELDMQSDTASLAGEYEQKVTRFEKELASARNRLTELEYERNVLATETVPNLKKDKEDMAAVLEDQVIDFQRFRSESGRRQALAYTLAAAAGIMMVLVPMLHMTRTSGMATKYEAVQSELMAQVDEAESKLADAETERLAMEKRLSDLSREYTTAQAQWSSEKATLQKTIETSERELAQARQVLDTHAMAPSRDSVRAANARAGVQTDDRATLTVRTHRNEVRGVDQWLERRRARQSDSGSGETRYVTAVVQRGEGLSDVLRRSTGAVGDATVWDEIGRINNLQKHARGFWIIHPGQTIKLPKNPNSVASAQ